MTSAKRTRSTARKKYVPSEEQRADDERLREELRNADIGKFKRALKKMLPAITTAKKRPES